MLESSSSNDLSMNNVFMKRALELAKKGIGFTSPNPCVGAVIEKGGKIVAEGWHKVAGGSHAEVIVINDVMKKSGIVTVDLDPTLFSNATLYVTLEPCSHVGKTPPCANLIVSAGFKKVCVGMKDPFKKVNGRGLKVLANAGVKVEVVKANASLADEIRSINQPFIKWAKLGLPYVIMKSGMSLDGKIATNSGDSKWITGPDARKDARIERSLCDAVLVGAGTVRSDDPELAPHGKYRKKKLLRVVIDRKLTLDLGSKVFRDENVFVACTGLASASNIKRYEKAGINFKSFGPKEISIKKLLKHLVKMGVQSLYVEGGSAVHGAFFDAALKDSNLLDKVLFYIAPKLIGGADSVPVVGGQGASSLNKSVNFEKWNYSVVGENLKVEGILNSY